MSARWRSLRRNPRTSTIVVRWIATISCVLFSCKLAVAGPPSVATPPPDPTRSAAQTPAGTPSESVLTFVVPVQLKALNIDTNAEEFVRYGPVVKAAVGCAVTENPETYLDFPKASPIQGEVFTLADVRDAYPGHGMGPAFKVIGQTTVPLDTAGNYDGPPIEVRTSPIPNSAIPRGWACWIVGVREKNGSRTRTKFVIDVDSQGRPTGPLIYKTAHSFVFGVTHP